MMAWIVIGVIVAGLIFWPVAKSGRKRYPSAVQDDRDDPMSFMDGPD